MLGMLIQAVGLWFLVAVALEAAAVFVEQWGASRSPDDEARKHGALALLAFVLTLLTPSVLLAHAFFATQAGDQSVRVIAMVAVIVAILAGALVGAILGASARGAAPLMRKLALPFDVLAFAAAIFAALDTIRALVGA
jgi:arginine exporter protein ArgO